MAIRGRLVYNHLRALDEYMSRKGWWRILTKGTHEVRRYVKRGKKPVLIFKRDTNPSLTVQDKDANLLTEFMRQLRRRDDGTYFIQW